MGGKNMSHQASECVYVEDWDGERREMWKSEPAGNISPGKLMRDKYLHTDVTTHSRTKEQHTAMAFPERAHKDQPLTRGNEQSCWVAPCYPGLKRPR